MSYEFHGYLKDLVTLLRERATEANAEASKGAGDDLQAGRALAYAEVLSTMQNQAVAFMIPLSELGLDEFDPVADLGRAAANRKKSD